MSVTQLEFTIPGAGEPQGSTRAFALKTGRVVITSANKRLAAWRNGAVFCIRQAKLDAGMGEPWEGPVRVWMTDCRLKPKGAGRRTHPHVKPDLDKIVRAVLDALTEGGVIRDDAQVCEIEAYKCYSKEPRVDVVVYRIIDTWPKEMRK